MVETAGLSVGGLYHEGLYSLPQRATNGHEALRRQGFTTNRHEDARSLAAECSVKGSGRVVASLPLCKSDKSSNFSVSIGRCPFSAKKIESPKVPKVPILYKKREKR